MGPTTTDLRDRLVELTTNTLQALIEHHVPGWRIPGTFGGHPVGADVRADACWTLTQLAATGVSEVAGEAVETAIAGLLGGVDGAATHTFFSARIAETLLAAGSFGDNPLLVALTEAQRSEVAAAVDTTDWVELADAGLLPANYAAVLARAELGRVNLGLAADTATLDDLVARTATVLGAKQTRGIDDDPGGGGRYDIYSADVWLFCHPLADRLGALWDDGFAAALDLVATVGCRDGTAVPWGRSTGDLGAALTVEVATLALGEGRPGDRAEAARWLRRAADATATLGRAFDADGLANAHRHRAQDRYRGPARRLQLTLDLLGKLAWSAALLSRPPADSHAGVELTAAPVPDAYPTGDVWRPFETDRPAGVWAHRRPGLEVVIPFVGGVRSHYLASPQGPGTWEVPVDRPLACWAPLVTVGDRRFTTAGVPVELTHEPGRVTATWHGLAPLDGAPGAELLAGTRTATWSMEGRSVVLEDRVRLAERPDGAGVVIPETAEHPLAVEWSAPDGAPPAGVADTVTTEGLAEWRSAWSSLGRVHQLDLDPATELAYRVRVTPALRVASTAYGHHYHESLYRPMADRVVDVPSPVGWMATGGERFDRLDLFHLHWPEWLAFDDLDAHRSIIEELRDEALPVVWTAHNLTPHEKRPEAYEAIYAAWAEAADAVIHHSAWGEAKMRARYRFSERCRHAVIGHGHFGGLWAGAGMPSRAEAERRLGLGSVPLRISVVGAPRSEKLTGTVLEAVAACHRDDVELVCWSLRDEEAGSDGLVPDDERIAIARPYRMVDRATYATRLAACDVLALIYDPEGEMLATGVAADASGLAMPALRSDWGYLVEALGGGGIPAGHTVTSVAAAIDALDEATLTAARAGAEARRAELDWAVLAEHTADLFERVVQTRDR